MRSRSSYSVTPRKVHDQALEILTGFVLIKDHGYKCTASIVTKVLLYAAARVTSICDACLRLMGAPSDDAVFAALAATLPTEQRLSRRLNQALVCQLPSRVFKRRWQVAIDVTQIPYHGEAFADPAELCRGKPKGGTTHFHGYATACIAVSGCRYTLGMTAVRNKEPMHEVLRRLLGQIGRKGLKIRHLLLDRAFYNLDVVSYLQNARYAFVIPAVHRGRRAKDPAKAQGTQRFLIWKRSGWSEHVMRNKGRSRKVQIAVAYVTQNARGKPCKPKVWVYAFWKMRPPSLQWLRDRYRERFGIETSYRQMNQARIRTCTRNPLLRLLFVGIALILRNLWVWFHHTQLSRHQRGKLQVNLKLLRIRVMLLQLQRFIEAVLQTDDTIELQLLEIPSFTLNKRNLAQYRNY
jgi:putative transposase